MEIEITPQMIEAGKRSICGGDTMSEEQMCEIIYRAMETERRRQIGQESPPSPHDYRRSTPSERRNR
jgi:hypothetical protein